MQHMPTAMSFLTPLIFTQMCIWRQIIHFELFFFPDFSIIPNTLLWKVSLAERSGTDIWVTVHYISLLKVLCSNQSRKKEEPLSKQNTLSVDGGGRENRKCVVQCAPLERSFELHKWKLQLSHILFGFTQGFLSFCVRRGVGVGGRVRMWYMTK